MKIKSILALQLNDNDLKILHFKKAGAASSMLACGTLEISPAEEVGAAQALRRFLDELGIRTPWAIVSLARTHVTTRLLTLPSTDSLEIKKMAGFQALKQIPFSKDEIVLDYALLGKTPEGYSQILLAMVHKKVVQKALDLLEKAGLTVLSLRLSSEEAASFYRNYWEEKNKTPTRTLFIDFDYASTEFVLMDQGRHRFSRSVAIGKTQLGDKTCLEKLAEELEKTLTLYKKEEPEWPIQKAVLVEAPPAVLGTFQARSPEWGLVFEAWNPQERWLRSAKKSGVFRIPSAQVSFSPLFGMLDNPESAGLNFYPEIFDQFRKTMSVKKELVRFSVLAVCFFILLGGLLFFKTVQQEAVLNSLKKQTEQTHPLALGLKKKKEKIQLIEKQRDKKNFSLDALAEIYRIIPLTISIDSYSYDAHFGVSLKGTAYTLSDVFNLIPKLEESPYFEKVSSKGTTTKKIKDKVYTDFHLDLPLAAAEGANE